MIEDKEKLTEASRSKLLEEIKTLLSGVRIDEAKNILKSMFQYIENVQNSTKL
jgi:hypothetical protein|nr:MAG TPA: hypothetical protein [Caudoviricetes sp.]